jgi:hypothetical protein
MASKIKISGLLVVALALSALGASSAQAANFFHNHIGEVNPDQVIITGTNVTTDGTVHPHSFFAAPGAKPVVCKKALFEGTHNTEGRLKDEGEPEPGGKSENEKPLPFTHENATTKVKTITSTSTTVTPTYSECEVEGVGAVTVTNNGCHYRLTAETSAEEHGGVHVECGATGSITITAKTCVITIKSQTVGKGVHYENTGETKVAGKLRDIDINATASGIVSTTNKNLVCLAAGIPNEGKEGTYTGKATIRAFEDKEKYTTGATISEIALKEGKQLDLWWGPTI